MRLIFKVYPSTKTIRLTSSMVKDGFDGELEGYANACTFSILKPGTTLDQAIESLEGTIRDLRLRKKLGKNIVLKAPVKPKAKQEESEKSSFDSFRQKLGGR